MWEILEHLPECGYFQCNGEVQHVLHYWYTAWPDHKPPESPDRILELVKEVEQRRYSENTLRVRGPVVVHCRYMSLTLPYSAFADNL